MQLPDFGAAIRANNQDRRQQQTLDANISRNNTLSELALGKQKLAERRFDTEQKDGARQALSQVFGRMALGAAKAQPGTQMDSFAAVMEDPSVQDLLQKDPDAVEFLNKNFVPNLEDPNKMRNLARHFLGKEADEQFDIREGIGPDGQPITARVSRDSGSVIPLDGLRPTQRKGTSFRSDGQGGFSVDIDGGSGTAAPLGTSTRNKVEANTLDLQGVRDSLLTIRSQFQPKFQQLTTRGDIAILRGRVKAQGKESISPEDVQLLEEYAGFRANAAQNVAANIKALSGTAASDKEVERLLGFLPNVGEGIFDGDDEVTFKSKLDEAVRRTNRALARAQYALTNGIALADDGQLDGNALSRQIPLSSVDALIDQRGQEVEQALLAENPDIKAAELHSKVRAQLSQEFGIQ